MECLGADHWCHTVAIMAGSQLGKSETGNNWLAWIMAQSPGPTLLVQPTTDRAEEYSRERIAPMIEACPALAAIIAPARSRDSGNNVLSKQFPGGFLKIVGSNAPSGLASTPIRRVFLDEVDRFADSSGGEGDPIRLAIQRTATFANRKILITSTPTIEGFSKIEAAYLAGDRRRLWLPCPHCHEMQLLTWPNVKWPSGRPDLAYYECAHCGAQIQNHDKNWMLPRGEWRAEAVAGPGEMRRQPSFWVNSIYAPHGWSGFSALAIEFCEAAGDPEKMKVFVNTKLAETFKAGSEAEVKATGLAERAERWPAEVPAGVAMITAGVDVQDDRLEVEIVGWGAGEESWSLGWHCLPGDPSGPALWRELAAYLGRKWQCGGGVTMGLSAAAIDSGGHHTQQVYSFAAANVARRWWAIKGASGPRPLWPKRPSRRKSGAMLYIVGVETGKESVYARLRIQDGGPGALHFPVTHPADYYQQLTAERIEQTTYRGRVIRRWVKPPGRRNEALDCRVYAYAALHGLLMAGHKLPKLAAPAPMIAPAPAVPAALETIVPKAQTVPQAPARVKRPSIYAELR
jgi:phage terminase large subunit GpA-like protein